MKKYVFKPYSKIFPELFSKEKQRILSCIKRDVVIEHVGSTAVPSLGGKGIIDIALAAKKGEMDLVSQDLQQLGYEFRPTYSTTDRLYFIIYLPDPEEETRRYHLHLTYLENMEWEDFLGFRDYLKTHPKELQEYAELKKQAALESDQDGKRYRSLKEPIFEKIRSLSKKKSNRPKVSVYIAMSLDGYIAGKEGSLEWLNCVHGFDEDYGFQTFFNGIDALILGRKTYETVASMPNWPYEGKKVIVLSSSMQSVKREAELFQGDLSTLLSQLHLDGIKHIWVDGGMTISYFLEAQLVDFMILSVIPVILGSGTSLFSGIENELSCQLISSKAYPSGLVQLHYKM